MDSIIAASTIEIIQAGIIYLYPFIMLKPKYSAEYMQHKCKGDPRYPMKAEIYINEARDGETTVKCCIMGIDKAMPLVGTPDIIEKTIGSNIAIN